MKNINNLILHLSLIDGIGPVTISTLIEGVLEKIEDLQDLYSFKLNDLSSIGISLKNAQLIINGLLDLSILNKELMLLEKNGINFISFKDDAYPIILKNIYACPSILYFKGAPVWNDFENLLACVGSRKANSYGKKITEILIKDAVMNNFLIISGGAFGIDAYAHENAIKNGGKTIVVLGSGLLNIYPKEHEKLFNEVIKFGGAIISSFKLNASAAPGNFPARNRIISGMSQVCLVIQAAKKSGSLITASYALEQGKIVCAVPGQIDDILSQGCNNLISQGAKLVSGFDSILEELNLSPVNDQQLTLVECEKVENKIIKFENKDEILSFISKNPISIEDLIEKTEMDEIQLLNRLFDFQIQGLITQNFVGMWYLI